MKIKIKKKKENENEDEINNKMQSTLFIIEPWLQVNTDSILYFWTATFPV